MWVCSLVLVMWKWVKGDSTLSGGYASSIGVCDRGSPRSPINTSISFQEQRNANTKKNNNFDKTGKRFTIAEATHKKRNTTTPKRILFAVINHSIVPVHIQNNRKKTYYTKRKRMCVRPLGDANMPCRIQYSDERLARGCAGRSLWTACAGVHTRWDAFLKILYATTATRRSRNASQPPSFWTRAYMSKCALIFTYLASSQESGRLF